MKNSRRNNFEALNHVLNVECIPALNILTDVCAKEEEIIKRIKKWPPLKADDKISITLKREELTTLKRALVCLLCIRIANIFGDKRGISFSDLNIKLKEDNIVQKIKRTRYTWFGHIDKNINDIVTGNEIIKSNLKNKLEDLSKLLITYQAETIKKPSQKKISDEV